MRPARVFLCPSSSLSPPHRRNYRMPLVNAIREKLGSFKQSSRPYVPMGRLWPNGEFSLGYAQVGDETSPKEEWSWTGGTKGLSPDELDARLEYMESWLEYQEAAAGLPAPMALRVLTLSNAPDSHKGSDRVKQGLKGLTSNGAKMLRSACYLLEDKLGKDDCVMITLTVPTIGREARRVLALQWGKVSNRLVQYLTRELLKAGRPPAIAGCVEIQSGRLEKYRQAYLHLHLVCPAHSNTGGSWAIGAGDLRTWWKAELERTIQSTLPTSPRVEVAVVKKSVEGYLGKYLSKGGGEELSAFIEDLGEDAVPAQWWFMSSPMRQAVRSATKSGSNVGALLDAVVSHLLEEGTGEGFEYVRHIDCEMNGLPITVGWVGRLTPDMRLEICSMLDD